MKIGKFLRAALAPWLRVSAVGGGVSVALRLDRSAMWAYRAWKKEQSTGVAIPGAEFEFGARGKDGRGVLVHVRGTEYEAVDHQCAVRLSWRDTAKTPDASYVFVGDATADYFLWAPPDHEWRVGNLCARLVRVETQERGRADWVAEEERKRVSSAS